MTQIKTKVAQWFEVTVKVEKTMDDGTQKMCREQYVVEAITPSDAEKKITEEMTPYINGEFEVRACKAAPFMEVVFIDGAPWGPKWFKVKVAFLEDKDRQGLKRTNAQQLLVQGNNFEQACEAVKKWHEGSVVDMEVLGITETKCLDVLEKTIEISIDVTDITKGKIKELIEKEKQQDNI